MDILRYAIQIGHYIGIGETDHAIPLSFQKRRSLGIVQLGSGVRVSIDFDDELGVLADKIGVERTQALLPAKFVAVKRTAPQYGPKLVFGRRRLPTKLPGSLNAAVIRGIA